MKYFFTLLTIFILSSCGVKGPPKAPEGTSLPPLLAPYQQVDERHKQEDDSENND